jgi:hypothetical protein
VEHEQFFKNLAALIGLNTPKKFCDATGRQ